jgi:[protein-PII] uridylyltransferase
MNAIHEINIQIEELIGKNATDFEISKLIRTNIKDYLSRLDILFSESQGKDFFVKHTKVIDEFMKVIFKYILRKYFGNYMPMTSSIPITLIALGSYGREQLCIYSDIDLLVLYKDVNGYNLKPMIQEMLTIAWDSGLKLGHRVHEIDEICEIASSEITIKTSIIESRMIYGSKYLWFNFENLLAKIRLTNQKEFILEKLEEHKIRLQKNPLVMEANIKDGYGGMRESNMLFWMANIIYGVDRVRLLVGKVFTEEEYKEYRSSLEFVFRVRNALHLLAKKKLDKVLFDELPALSAKLGFEDTPKLSKERQCMTKLFESLHKVHSFSANIIKKITRKYLFEASNIPRLKHQRIAKNLFVCDGQVFTTYANKPKSLNTFLKELLLIPNCAHSFDRSYLYYAQKTIVPSKLSKEIKKSVKSLFFHKDHLFIILRVLYNTGLLVRVIPSMKRIMNQPQFDGYHKHPVDVHTLKTVYFLENISDKFVAEVYNSLTHKDRGFLKLVAFFHDIGKGRSVDHHLAGEKIFRAFGKNMELEDEQIEMGCRLIKIHTLMSRVATREDVYSQRVIQSFVGAIQNELALKLLYVLTYADICSVAENLYKTSTASMLKELYFQSLIALSNTELVLESARRVHKEQAVRNSKHFKSLSSKLQKNILSISCNQIFLREKAEDIISLSVWAQNVNTFEYKIINEEFLKIQIIRAIPLNLGFLLGKLSVYLNIANMKIFKLFDEKKFFEITFSQKIDQSDMQFLRDVIENSFDMTKQITLKKPIIYSHEVEIDCHHSDYLAQMKIDAKDQKGLFAYIAKVFDDYGIDIESAKLYTSRGRAKDLLLVLKNGNFCPNSQPLMELIVTKQ